MEQLHSPAVNQRTLRNPHSSSHRHLKGPKHPVSLSPHPRQLQSPNLSGLCQRRLQAQCRAQALGPASQMAIHQNLPQVHNSLSLNPYLCPEDYNIFVYLSGMHRGKAMLSPRATFAVMVPRAWSAENPSTSPYLPVHEPMKDVLEVSTEHQSLLFA